MGNRLRVIGAICIFAFAVHSGAFAETVLTHISIEDKAGVARQAWPITGGLPLPKGLITDVSKIGIRDIPTQTRVLSRWSDGSIKWVLLDFQAALEAGQQQQLAVVIDDFAPITGNVVTETADYITVDTGVLRLQIAKQSFSFLHAAWFDANNNGDYQDAGEQVVLPNSGQRQFLDVQTTQPNRPSFEYRARNLITNASHTVSNSTPTVAGGPIWMRPEGGGAETTHVAGADQYVASIREHGPLKTVIEIKGGFPTTTTNDWEGHTYSMWIHVYKDQSFMRVQHNFLVKGDPRNEFIRRIGLELPLNIGATPTFNAAGLSSSKVLAANDEAYLFNSGPEDVFHLYHKGFHLPWTVQAGTERIEQSTATIDTATQGYIDVTGSSFGVTSVIQDMAQQYPKELSYNPQTKKITTWLWPDHGDLVMDLNATGWLDVAGKHGMQGMSFSHDIYYNFHNTSATDYAAFAKKVNAPIQPYANPTWYSHRGTKAAGMIMPYALNSFPKTEAFMAVGTAFIGRSAHEFGWLGMLNYGNIMQDYSYNESGTVGTWGLSQRQDDYDGWRNGNTMLSYRMYMQYLRTGNYDFWRMSERHSKHIRDVRIKHYNAFRDQLPQELQWVGMGRRHSAYWGAGPSADQHGGVSIDGYGTNWMGQWVHWNLTGDWRTYDVLGEIRDTWNEFGNNAAVPYISGASFVGLKLIGGIPGYDAATNEAELYKTQALNLANYSNEHRWRDVSWYFGYGLYLQDYTQDTQIAQALTSIGTVNPSLDEYGIFWHRDGLSVAYWAAEGDSALQETIYQRLKQHSTDSKSFPNLTKRMNLLSSVGLDGLFTSNITNHADAVSDLGYWRTKDTFIQQEWDEPLAMAVIDFHENGIGEDTQGPAIQFSNPGSSIGIDQSLEVVISDLQNDINQSTYIMKANGVAVTPTLTGSGRSVTLTFPLNSTYSIGQTLLVEVTAEDIQGNQTVATHSYTVSAITMHTVTVNISQGNDDAYALFTDPHSVTDNFLRLGRPDANYRTAVLFRGLSIPKNATVTNALVTFYTHPDETNDNSTENLTVKGFEASFTGPFTPSDLGDAAVLSYTLPWDFSGPWADNSAQSTPDLTALLQHILDNSSVETITQLGFQFENSAQSGDTRRTVYSYEEALNQGLSQFIPSLTVSYQVIEEGSGPVIPNKPTNLKIQ